MRKPSLQPVFGKLGLLQPNGAAVLARPSNVWKDLKTSARSQQSKSSLIWLAVKIAIGVWVAAIVAVLFGWLWI
ncbi:MAG: hypothetical protein ABJB10_15265 [Mesorhizobium sp.]